MKNTTKTPQQVINDKSSKWTIKPATNRQVFDSLTVGFLPFELMTDSTATEWNAATALSGEKVNATKPLNAIRAAFLAAKFALDFGGRISSRVAEIIATNSAIIEATDNATAEYTDIRNAYSRAKKAAQRDALIYGASTDDRLKARAENSAKAAERLKAEAEAARRILAEAIAAENSANAAIIAEYADQRKKATEQVTEQVTSK